MKRMFQTLETFDTEFSADSVEWCPADSSKDIFACGTYQLAKGEESATSESSKRLGRIYLFRVNDGHLSLLQQLNVPAVLDMKWAHVEYQKKMLLGVVNSLGYLQVYELEDKSLKLIAETRVNDDETEVLALSLDWCSGRWKDCGQSNLKIIVSDSKGVTSLFEIKEMELRKINSWPGHEFEAWIAAFDYWDTNVVYTGGDDCKFNRIDVRTGSSVAIRSVHDAGVTSIHSNAAKEFLLASGSYDETLRLWDTRQFKRPISETKLGGGIWRLKWDPFSRQNLLAACMYGGFKVIDCETADGPSIIGEYEEHESIAYGCDWSFLSPEEISERNIFETKSNVRLVGTCSFYDHALKLSAVYIK